MLFSIIYLAEYGEDVVFSNRRTLKAQQKVHNQQLETILLEVSNGYAEDCLVLRIVPLQQYEYFILAQGILTHRGDPRICGQLLGHTSHHGYSYIDTYTHTLVPIHRYTYTGHHTYTHHRYTYTGHHGCREIDTWIHRYMDT